VTDWQKRRKSRSILPSIGTRFGMLVFMGDGGVHGETTDKKRLWLVKCDCGVSRIMFAANIKSSANPSCGCLRKENIVKACTKHGKRSDPIYAIWCSMIRRCHEPKCKSYAYYGARGISVCPQWRNSFSAFYEYVGDRPSPKHSLDRIDNGKGYEPGNCRWATVYEQAQNTRNNKLNAEKVIDLRKRYKGGASYKELALIYGILPSHVGRVVNRQCWGNIP
jgi:hypothetical protein